MNAAGLHILVYGYGNPGRGDDGLGPALVAALEALGADGLDCESDYQLAIEEAPTLPKYDVAVFVDANASRREPFWSERVQPPRQLSFSSHSPTPAQVVGLAH